MGGRALLDTWERAKQHPKLLLCCTALALGTLALTSRGGIAGSFRPGFDAGQSESQGAGHVSLKGVLESIHTREVVWQIPEGLPPSNLKGVAFFAHGCSHKATHFWPKSESCAKCTGLPEDAKNVKVTLSRGYAVIAVSSLGQCWDSSTAPHKSGDITDVAHVLQHWRAKNDLEQLPLVAMGASSGGYFISSLAHAIRMDALVVMISSGVKEAFSKRPDFGFPYPPTLFIHMPRDQGTNERVKHSLKILESQGVHAAEIQCSPMKFGPSFLSSRIEGFNEELSRSIYDTLVEAELIDEGGFLVPKYRTSWKPAIQGRGIYLENEDLERIEEELKLAFGWHEMTSEFAEEMVDWFDGICISRKQGHASQDVSNKRCTSYE